MEVDDESVSTGRGSATASDVKRRRNDGSQDNKPFGEKQHGSARQASETAGRGVKDSEPEVKHYDADGKPAIRSLPPSVSC